jgi:hypothetical protein
MGVFRPWLAAAEQVGERADEARWVADVDIMHAEGPGDVVAVDRRRPGGWWHGERLVQAGR